MSNENIVLLGGGGFALELVDYLHSENIGPLGYCAPGKNSELNGVLPYLGRERDTHDERFQYLLASGYVEVRRKMIDFLLSKPGIRFYSYISAWAYVSNMASIGSAIVVAPGAVVAGNATIDNFGLINIGASIGHHCQIGENVVICPGARISGWSEIGNDVLIGSNAITLPEARIGSGATIGAGTVISDLPSGRTAFGNPGRHSIFL